MCSRARVAQLTCSIYFVRKVLKLSLTWTRRTGHVPGRMDWAKCNLFFCLDLAKRNPFFQHTGFDYTENRQWNPWLCYQFQEPPQICLLKSVFRYGDTIYGGFSIFKCYVSFLEYFNLLLKYTYSVWRSMTKAAFCAIKPQHPSIHPCVPRYVSN